MEHGAGGLFATLEQSGLGLAIRDAVLVYPLANVAHVVAVLVFFAAVAVMDLRVLGLIGRGENIQAVFARFRPVAIAAGLAIVVTGAILFIPEAAAVARNASFQVKAALVIVGLANVGVMGLATRRLAPGGEAGSLARASALGSLVIWLAVAACGRFIAYA